LLSINAISQLTRIRNLPALLAGILVILAFPAHAQVSGSAMANYAQTFGLQPDQTHYDYSVKMLSSSAPGNILFPGDFETVSFQVINNTQEPLNTQGKIDVIDYGTHGQPGDVWTPVVFQKTAPGYAPINVNAPAGGSCVLTLSVPIPKRMGGYALVVDLGTHGRQFLTTFARTFATTPQRIQYPHFCLDGVLPLPVLERLGVHAVRYETHYLPTTDPGFPAWYAAETARLRSFQKAGLVVLYMVESGNPTSDDQPLGRPRPFLDDNDTMLDTKADGAWLPSYDDDFQKFCHIIAANFGYPKGPINAFELWNEPWEGSSISGWGADMIRFRTLYTHMFNGVDEARKNDGVDLLVGGCDSTTNAFDKLFGDGSDKFLPMFDYVSEHYQGLNSVSTSKMWLNRTGPHGRVKVWDTESWVANTDDRVAAVVAADRAAGFDRAMGVYYGNVSDEQRYTANLPDGSVQNVDNVEAWSTAAAVGATTHFIGERPFNHLLFQNGLPWVMSFDGLPGVKGKPDSEDGTLVVIGDLGDEFGSDVLPFRTARGFAEERHKSQLRAQLAALPVSATAEQRLALEAEIATPETLTGATMTIDDPGRFTAYDTYGNPIPEETGKIVIPLDGRGFFLRGDGKPGSFAALERAVQNSNVRGIEPLAIVAHDMTAPVTDYGSFHLTITNVLNRPVSAALNVSLPPLTLSAPQHILLAPNQTKDIAVKIVSGISSADNSYPLEVKYAAGNDGGATFDETLHVNYIARKTISVDGDLSDWAGVLPQTIIATGSSAPTLTEQAWLPYKGYSSAIKSGLATGYLAYDNHNFYFAAKIADSTPDPGMIRMTTRDNDADFYPAVSYQVDPNTAVQKMDWVADDNSAKPWALQQPNAPQTRIIAGWQDTVRDFDLDLHFTDGKTHQVAFYFVDADDLGRREQQVTIKDYDTGQVLDTKQLSDFRLGKYLVYDLSGHLKISFSRTMWLPASVSGIFFDAASAAALGNSAQFVKQDTSTQGNWVGVYGLEGYNVIQSAVKNPSYVTVETPLHLDKIALTWPSDVRRYSYRRSPELPSGSDHDNVQIAFNVLPDDQKPWLPAPPGVMPGFIGQWDTDYEYALNPVADQYGGGTEIWRLIVPGMPRKNFYPRQPASPYDGAVAGGKLVITHDAGTRIVECSIPWTEMSAVKAAIDAGKPVKFTFRVNDNGGAPTMELARDRSVSKVNPATLHPDWVQHWSNELEFGAQR